MNEIILAGIKKQVRIGKLFHARSLASPYLPMLLDYAINLIFYALKIEKHSSKILLDLLYPPTYTQSLYIFSSCEYNNEKKPPTWDYHGSHRIH